MAKQVIVTPNGERLVVLSEAEYEALVDAAEDAEDIAAVACFRGRLAAGEEELLPATIVDRMLGGENAVRVWRHHRGLTAIGLAEQAGIAEPYLSQIETGEWEGTVDAYRRLARALGVTMDDLI